jgi:regulator of extracellular matrix RemA (YlzA/DUF370 family)
VDESEDKDMLIDVPFGDAYKNVLVVDTSSTTVNPRSVIVANLAVDLKCEFLSL